MASQEREWRWLCVEWLCLGECTLGGGIWSGRDRMELVIAFAWAVRGVG